MLFAGCFKASCQIELSIYLCIETLEILQEGFFREEFKLSTYHRLTDEQKLWVSWPLDSIGVCFFIVWTLGWNRYMSFFRQEILFSNCQSNRGPMPWRVCGQWRSTAFVRTHALTLKPSRIKLHSLTESYVHRTGSQYNGRDL